ncbi:adhesion G protein-coupled receptor L4-like [Antedon mediterranea]|uniref:adhesion G protein-coupled receptor L4-like n=1 Tax=Antedon mediterranea TaxID=105859 RepID=UPI003AF609A4
MKPIPSNINDKTLSIITNVGLAISSLFLIITLITIYSFKSLRNSERHKILCHLVVALLIVNFFYAFLGVNVKNKIVCAAIAGCLHYSLLAAFAWMLIVSTDVYMKIRHPFANHERRFLFSRYLGWIVPSIIVGVTAGCTRKNYVSDEVCWLKMDFAIWTFIIPMAITLIIISVQIVVIGHIALTKTRFPTRSKEDKNSIKRIRSLAFGLILLAPVVGLPWIFGIIILFSSSKVMEYIFVIMNSFQGFFIWLSQCVFSNEVQYKWKKKTANRIHPDTITMTDTTKLAGDQTNNSSYHR